MQQTVAHAFCLCLPMRCKYVGVCSVGVLMTACVLPVRLSPSRSTLGSSRRALRPATTPCCRRVSWRTRTRSATALGCASCVEIELNVV